MTTMAPAVRRVSSPGGAVLHVAQPTDGGVARYLADLAVHQLAAGWRVAVACPPHGRLVDDLAGTGVRLLPWSADRLPGPSVPGEVRRLAKLIATVDPALVHLHSSKAGLVGRLAVRGARGTVFQPHAWSVHAVPRMLRPAAAGWERRAAGWTDLLLCGADDERRLGRALGIPGRYAVVPNGVDVERFDFADAHEQARARSRLGLGDAPLAVCIGRLCRQKGQDLLLTAWQEVASALPAAALALVGGGPPPAGASAGPGLVLAGSVRDPRDWYAAADVVVCPSRWEGMALVPLEAMARGRSVVATDVGGTRQAVPPDAGALVPPG
ncbi:MAG: glycosyltransferase, partial [Micromonospora sp.]